MNLKGDRAQPEAAGPAPQGPAEPLPGPDPLVLRALVRSASEAEICHVLLRASVELTGAAGGAVQCRASDGFTGPWATERVLPTVAERLNRVLDSYAPGGTAQSLEPHHPVLLSLEGRHRPHGILRVVSTNCDEFQITLLLVGQEDGSGFTRAHASVLDVLVAIASVACSAAAQRESRRRFEEWTDAVESTATLLLGGLSASSVLVDVLEAVARRALAVSRADMCAIATPDDSGRSMVLRVALGRHRQTLSGLAFSELHSLSGTVARSSRQLVVEDAATDGRATSVAAEVALGPTVIAPLVLHGKNLGVLFVGNTRGERPLEHRLAVDAVTVRDLDTWIGDASGAALALHRPDLQGLVRKDCPEAKRRHELPPLTDREFDLLTLVAEGLTNAEIGSRLFLAEKTVRNSVSRLLAKLGLTNRVEAAVLTIRYLERHRRLGESAVGAPAT